MKFGSVPVGAALGGITAHTVTAGPRVIRKGTVLGPADMVALAEAGVVEVVVARLDPEDVAEDAAASRLAVHLAGEQVSVDRAFTGRVNLHADTSGLVLVDRAAIDRFNAVDEAVTFATLPAYAPVEPGRMVGTVKIIPYAVPSAVLEAAMAAAGGPVISVAPYRLTRAALIQTQVAGTPDKVLDKTRRVTDARLAAMGASITAEERVPHDPRALADAIARQRGRADLVLVFGASAIADRRDVIPTAIEAAGGQVRHFGMPVDPGNLLLVGDLDGTPVLGAPGCARSPRENGFDWVLARLVAGLPVTRADITAMGVGGLLMEIASRPQPREEAPTPAVAKPRVAALLLAAGRSTRMGGPNKLLETVGGVPVVRRALDALGAAGIADVTLVTGHMAEAVEAAAGGRATRVVRNPDYAEGLSTSLKAGLAALPPDADAVLVALGDMPGVGADLIRRMVAAFDPVAGRAVVVPTREGKRGNPVLWARRFVVDLAAVQGDVGARHLLGVHAAVVAEVPADDDGALLDVDTPEALAAARGRWGG